MFKCCKCGRDVTTSPSLYIILAWKSLLPFTLSCLRIFFKGFLTTYRQTTRRNFKLRQDPNLCHVCSFLFANHPIIRRNISKILKSLSVNSRLINMWINKFRQQLLSTNLFSYWSEHVAVLFCNTEAVVI